MKLGLGELYIVITDSTGDTLVGLREDINASITSKKLSRELNDLVSNKRSVMNLIIEAQRLVDKKNGKGLKDSKGRFAKKGV